MNASLSSARPALPFRRVLGSIAGLLLLVPLVAMQFTREVNWGTEDFAAMALLLGGLGFAVEIAVVKIRNPALRVAGVALLLAAFLVIWAELAVGIFD
jgi:hypothetical protein